jgi:exodeoxyribonuclease V gamma subunit
VFAGLGPGGLVRWRFGRLSAREQLGLWVEQLILAASAPNGVVPRTTLIGRAGGDGTPEILTFRPPADPFALLGELLTLRATGMTQPLPLFPAAAQVFIEQLAAGKSDDEALGLATKAYQGDARGRGDLDAYVELAFRGVTDPLGAEAAVVVDGEAIDFRTLAHRVTGPLRQHVEPSS